MEDHLDSTYGDIDELLLYKMAAVPPSEELLVEVSGDDLSEENKIKIANLIEDHGVCVVRGLADPHVVRSVNLKIDRFIDDNKDIAVRGKFTETENAIFDGTSQIEGGNKGKALQPKPVIHFRGEKDNGLIDIFNIERLVPEALQLRHVLGGDSIKAAINRVFPDQRPTNLNIYVNKSIQETRGFHYDSSTPIIKVFMYLTDVESVDDGPYCYVLGSHGNEEERRRSYRAKFVPKKKGDTLYVDPKKAFAFAGKAGDIIISCQHGAHRGYPQKENHERMVATMIYRPYSFEDEA
ncbi:phytanoyl-CoA dioxygenase family protein [Labrenzia sp. VG12]|uniref:phytanoyl-CoA dioxygenase family protein n=1 Tax=Labrenzia sp. VG12 TaxID=2021862 RepID=UPI0012FDF14F|nr:phytanoyl-CoA dioxygenase family protein [Labrenzia sp. VG12]